ncbi:MAG: hypothetical protein B9S32_16830 [Verrucomicrobia bacterium Tous-C9LFEB]|nr:MAG: hypothetical protein B9S32_16830 [Verrucomicrobia bacterium Tous-C9LFEB]
MHEGLHQHLRRLPEVWVHEPVYFITTCTHDRRPILASAEIAQILVSEWHSAATRHEWFVGRYVIMPDHIHILARPTETAKDLSTFMKRWKEWSAKRIKSTLSAIDQIWQHEFFDHLVRDSSQLESKWDYIQQNPVRAGLVAHAREWPYQGEIHTF